MQSLRTVLDLFFGLRDDHRIEAELNAAPLTFWRIVAGAMCLGLVLALAVLSARRRLARLRPAARRARDARRRRP